jgi:hypothetical protein
VQRVGLAVLEIAERLEEPEYLHPAKGPEDEGHWVELTVATEMPGV